MPIRREHPIVQPTRRAMTALRTHFDAREIPFPDDDRMCGLIIARERSREGRPQVEQLLAAAMGPDEATCVDAVRVIGALPVAVLEVYEGQLFALLQVYLSRRESKHELISPPVEAFLRHLPIWPDRKHFAYSVPNAPTVSFFEEVRAVLAGDAVLEDPAYPVLLELLERFPGLHGEAMERLRRGTAPSVGAARRIALAYEPAVIPLVSHPDETIAEAVRDVASIWLDRIEVPESVELEEFRTHADLDARLGRTRSGLVHLVLSEHRPDLIPSSLAARCAALVRTLAARLELERVDPTVPGHEFLMLAAIRADDGSVTIDLLEAMAGRMAEVAWPPKLLATLVAHPLVDDERLERILRRILEQGDRVIDQSRRLADPLFGHHRPAFRAIMTEGYRRTIGSPWLVEAVFMATPPEAIHESVRFLLVNNAQSFPRLVRRWVEEHPEAAGRIDVDPRVIARLKRDSHAGMALAGTLLERLQSSEGAVADPAPTVEAEEEASLFF